MKLEIGKIYSQKDWKEGFREGTELDIHKSFGIFVLREATRREYVEAMIEKYKIQAWQVSCFNYYYEISTD